MFVHFAFLAVWMVAPERSLNQFLKYFSNFKEYPFLGALKIYLMSNWPHYLFKDFRVVFLKGTSFNFLILPNNEKYQEFLFTHRVSVITIDQLTHCGIFAVQLLSWLFCR